MSEKKHLKNSKACADNLITWIREYAASRIDSRLADERGCFSPHVFLDLGYQGFFGMHVPHSYGGSDLKTYDMLRVIEQIAAIDLTLTTLLIEAIQGAHTLKKYASSNLKNKYLPQLASGRILVAGAMTESAAGSNPRAMQATAIPDGENGWLIKGNKRWVGMGYWANLIAVYVQQFDDQHNWLGTTGFLIPQNSKGLSIGAETRTMGIRAIGKHTIHLDNVKVTTEQLLDQVGQGMEIAQDNMMYVRLCLAAANVGAMKRSAQLIYRYAERRAIVTGQLLENPVTLMCLSELTTVIHAIENFVYLIAQLMDESPELVPEEALVCVKILGSEYLGWTVDKLVQILGARGYEESSGVSQLFRDARTFRIFEGPTEALTMYVGSRMLTLNSAIQHFVSNTLEQNKIFNEITILIDEVKNYTLHKKSMFSKPFSVDYLTQALVGDIVSYGLLLAIMEYSVEKNCSKENEKALKWARSKFDETKQRSLTLSPAEKVFSQPEKLKELIATYAEKIGDIEQIHIPQEISIDPLLKRLQEKNDDSYDETTHSLHNVVRKKTCETEQQKLLSWSKVEINATYPDVCVHKLFEEQTAKNPNSTAIIGYGETLTYSELNTRANQLAHYLKRKGVSTDTPVAICLERSAGMIVGILAVLKSGGVCVPLDHYYPAERLQFMLEDSEAQIVLTHKNLSEKLSFHNQQIIFLDEITESLSLESDINPTHVLDPNNLIYIIYTSGSTGKPKGVMLPHRALTNLIYWQTEKIKEKRNILQFTSLSFDMSFLEIFSAFSSGGTLTLISEHDRLDLLSFARIIKKNMVEQLMLPVPFLRKLAEANINTNYFSHLKEIIIAGEQLVVNAFIINFFNGLTNCKLLNYYGPAETHVVSVYELPNKTIDWLTHPPIGRPITHAKILILDEDLQQVPIGTVGELFLGGISVARGYKNKEALTQEKFMIDPREKNTEARLYRTGDFAKYLADGNILFLGRRDEQVKISGHRVELQEIEEEIFKYPGTKNVAVIAKSERNREKHLEAFFVTDSIIDENYIQKIRSFLMKTLPQYMIPTVFNSIDEMPLTPNGKIDKIALMKMNSAVNFSSNEIIAPQTDTEKNLVKIFEDFFDLRLGINNSFISIGGNSLLAMTIASKVYEQFSVEVPACAILSDPTIADISKRIDCLKKEYSNC